MIPLAVAGAISIATVVAVVKAANVALSGTETDAERGDSAVEPQPDPDGNP